MQTQSSSWWHLVKLEWLKMRSHKTVKISLVLYVILLPLLFLAVKAMFLSEGQAAATLRPLFSGSYLWDTLAYWASWLSFFLLVYLSVLSVSAEYTNRTLRQNLITGIERLEYLLGKGLMMITLSLFATIYLFLVTLIFLAIDGSTSWFDGADVLVRFFVQNLAYMSLAFMLTVMLRRSGLVMILFFAYVMLVERILRYLVFLNLFDNLEAGSYFPANVFWDVVPFFFANLSSMLDPRTARIILDEWLATGLAVGYIALFWGLTIRHFLRKDL